MSATSNPETPVRAGIFSTLPAADLAVRKLLEAEFSKDTITVVCSDDSKEKYFREFEHQPPAGAHAPDTVLVGTSVGAAVGGLTGIAVGAATGAVPLILAGVAGLSGGSAMGGFLGAMLTRGEEKELSNFYDQAVRSGKILVGVEEHGPSAPQKLARAERILREAGAEPVPLPEG